MTVGPSPLQLPETAFEASINLCNNRLAYIDWVQHFHCSLAPILLVGHSVHFSIGSFTNGLHYIPVTRWVAQGLNADHAGFVSIQPIEWPPRWQTQYQSFHFNYTANIKILNCVQKLKSLDNSEAMSYTKSFVLYSLLVKNLTSVATSQENMSPVTIREEWVIKRKSAFIPKGLLIPLWEPLKV